MNDEEMRVEIALSQGYVWWTHTPNLFHEPVCQLLRFPPLTSGSKLGKQPGVEVLFSGVPHYLHSLDAMSLVEESIEGVFQEDYYDVLSQLVPDSEGMFGLIHASPWKRARAYLILMGKVPPPLHARTD